LRSLAAGPLTSKCVVANAFWVAHRVGRAPAMDRGKRLVCWRDIRSGALSLQSLQRRTVRIFRAVLF